MKPGDFVERRYQIQRLLGEGGMGSVFLATDTTLGKPVALKTLLPKMMADLRAVEQLKREVRISQELRHENICATYDFRMSQDQPFLVMEYVDGDTLTNFLFRQLRQKCDTPTFYHLAAQILAGVGAAHRAGVIHRDLKSGNIMVTREGSVRVMDFGIAASLKETLSRTTGTPVSLSIHYASPEQINGEDPSVSMDVYSLGCVFYEMLSGHPPFRQGDILHQQLTRPPQPLSDVEPSLNSAVLSCLAKDPAARPPSTFGIQSALDRRDSFRATRVPPSAPRPAAPTFATTKIPPPLPPRPAAPAPPPGTAPSQSGTNINWLPFIGALVVLLVVVGIAILGAPSSHRTFPASVVDSGPSQSPWVPPPPPPTPSPVPVPPPQPKAARELTPSREPAVDHSAEIQRHFEEAQAALNLGFYEAAVEAYQAVLTLDRHNQQAITGLASARSAWDAERNLSPGNPPTKRPLTKRPKQPSGEPQNIPGIVQNQFDRDAKDSMERGDYSWAIQLYQAKLMSDPENEVARKGLAEAQAAKAAEEKAFGGKRK